MERLKNRVSARPLVFAAVGAALVAVLSQLSIPLPSGVPVTMQTFAVALIGYVLGCAGGSISITVYIALGAIGLPVFASAAGGIAAITGYTGGFIIGFLPFAALCGAAGHIGARSPLKVFLTVLLSALGLAACHLCGVLWYSHLSGNPFLPSFTLVSLPYLAKDTISVAGAYFIAAVIRKRLKSAL